MGDIQRIAAMALFAAAAAHADEGPLAPERLFMLDEPAAEVLKLVDGKRSVAVIVDALAERFSAPRTVHRGARARRLGRCAR